MDRFRFETVDAIRHLAGAGYYTQALVLLYSAIDALAWAALPTGDSTGADFRNWVREYMDPDTQIGCSPEDLYAARCGLLHSSTAESRISRTGQASELWYVTSARSAARLDDHQKRVGTTAKVVYFTAFVAAFADAVMRFSGDSARDPQRSASANARVQNWLRLTPIDRLNPDSRVAE